MRAPMTASRAASCVMGKIICHHARSPRLAAMLSDTTRSTSSSTTPDAEPAGDSTTCSTWTADVLHEYWSDALDWVRQAAAGTARRCSTSARGPVPARSARRAVHRRGRGRGRHLGASSWPGSKAGAERGLASRVRTVEADLDAGLARARPGRPHLGVDVAAPHGRPDRTLREALAATRPGGLIAVAEFSEPLRFLPDDLASGRPGLEARCLDALRQRPGRCPARARIAMVGAAGGGRLRAARASERSPSRRTRHLRPAPSATPTCGCSAWLRAWGTAWTPTTGTPWPSSSTATAPSRCAITTSRSAAPGRSPSRGGSVEATGFTPRYRRLTPGPSAA